MRILPLLAALATVTALSACKDEVSCTEAEAQKKATELANKITEVGTADPSKMAALMPKLQELSTKAAAAPDDLAATCKAMDDLMAELSK
ncbi:hypothetical protein [Xinfangfangia pollutisoli]|uniref:hypothetical protein n=1 Tax=Xinfangfangia pollutisoli TaxID=2865960 RepID=UPI001CD76B01|nr:hypothetical protein [Xinfangfangia pollutisoli]